MNGAHLHLLLNHLPVIGTIFAGVLAAAAYFRRSEELARAAFTAMAATATCAALAFLSGEPAEEALEALGLASESLIHAHEEAAEAALWASLAWGGLGAFGLWRLRARPAPASFWAVVLAGFLAAAGLMARAANLGGLIRHSELRFQDSQESSRAMPQAAVAAE